MMMKNKWLWLIFLAGCKSNYKAPEYALSNQFLTSKAMLDAENFNPQFWQALNDPVLNRLADLAMTNNYDYLIASEKISQLRAQYRFQTSQLYPQISGMGRLDRERDTQTLSYSQYTGSTFQTQYQLGFDAVWELDFFGAQLAAKQSAFFTMMSQMQKASYVKLSLVAELALQYISLRTFQTLNSIYQKEVEVLGEIQSLSQNRFGVGLNDQNDSLLNLARMQDKQALVEALQADISKLIFLVTQLTGQFPEKEIEVLKNYVPLKASIPLIYPDIPSAIVLNRPDVAAARYDLFSAQALLKKAYRDFFPQFNITSAFGVLTNFPNKLFTRPSLNWNITPGFNLTLIDFGALIAEKNSAKSQEKQALYAFEKSLVNAFTELETALSGLKATDLQIKNLEDELITLREKTANYKERYKIGLIDKTSYLEAYLEELILEESLNKSINARFGFVISFYKALGVGI